ncbi:MAG TPA: efflux RND transporter permease subunit, partial [Desulfobacterales bacterium]
MKQVIASFARNRVFANIILVIIFVAGGLAGSFMIRETFPEFSLEMIRITVAYPGADPEEVEEGISRKIEEAVEGLEGLKQYTTTSSEGLSSTILEVRENYEATEVLDRVKSKVDGISSFPPDAEQPIISEMLLRDTVMMISLSGDMSERRLKEWAEQVKDEIQQLPPVSQVELMGVRDYEIGIEVSEERLREYGLSFEAVVDAVRRSNMNMAGGTIRTEGEEIRVRTMGRKYTGRELSSIVVVARPEGEIITLDRLADIRDGFTEDPIRATVDGSPAVLVVVYKTSEEDALKISRTVGDFVRDKQNTLPDGVRIGVLYDSTDMLQDRIDLLTRNGLLGLILVLILLWIFMDLRLSFWVGMGIPISIAGALAILWAVGATINMISLFGLIMVLGIVVDDAIVVGEAIFHHRQQGQPPLKAAVEAVREVGLPVTAAVVTTVVAFLPLAYIGGIMGKFISILPVTVIACLVVSLVECLILLPAHLNHLPDPNRRPRRRDRLYDRLERINRAAGRGLEWVIERLYIPLLNKAIQWRYIALCTTISILLITVGLIQGGVLKFEVFPQVDGFVVTSTVEFPPGTPPEVTAGAVKDLEAGLLQLEPQFETRSGEALIESRLAIVGQTLGDTVQTGPNVGTVLATFLPSERRGIHSKDLEVAWEKNVGAIPGVKSLTFQGMAAGPPGAPIEIWLQGRDMDTILAAADDLMNRLGEFDGVYQIRSDHSPGKNEMRLTLKPEARTLGITVDDLARQVYAGFFGEEAVRLQRGREDIRVKVRYTADERGRLTDLERMRIRTRSGMEVPLLSVAEVRFAPGYAAITRTDGLRRVAVSAAVDTNRTNANEIFAALSTDFFPQLKADYPGLYVALQGEKKKMRESFESLFISFPLAVLGIFVIIATIFRSYVQPFVILVTVPFGIIGAVFGHLLLGFDLSIMSIFGMVALTGVVVNDAIVMIERINENLAGGMRFKDAIFAGGRRRFRAIILTTLSTVGGLAPLILETDLQARFLIPMAVSLAAGVAFATCLTLVFIPSLLGILNDFRLLAYRWKHGSWPQRREHVEPARYRRDTVLEDER